MMTMVVDWGGGKCRCVPVAQMAMRLPIMYRTANVLMFSAVYPPKSTSVPSMESM